MGDLGDRVGHLGDAPWVERKAVEQGGRKAAGARSLDVAGIGGDELFAAELGGQRRLR